MKVSEGGRVVAWVKTFEQYNNTQKPFLAVVSELRKLTHYSHSPLFLLLTLDMSVVSKTMTDNLGGACN